MAKEALTAVRDAELAAAKTLADAAAKAEEIRNGAKKAAAELAEARLEAARQDCARLHGEAQAARDEAEKLEREKTDALVREIGAKRAENGEAAVRAVLEAITA